MFGIIPAEVTSLDLIGICGLFLKIAVLLFPVSFWKNFSRNFLTHNSKFKWHIMGCCSI